MDESPQVVAVTGASGYVGTGLLGALEADERIEKIVAFDNRPLSLPFSRIAAQRVDITHLPDDGFLDHQVSSVVHLAFQIRPGHSQKEADQITQANLRGTEAVLNACREAEVSSLIFLSSHTVYGAHKDNPTPITEDTVPRRLAGFRYATDKAACEEMIRQYARQNPQVRVTILRSCIVLGPGADNYITQALFKPVFLRVLGYNPPLQFVHEHDLSRLLHHLVMDPQAGVFNVAADGAVPYSRIGRLASRPVVALPFWIAYPLVHLTWKLGVQKDSPAVGLQYIKHPIVMSTERLKARTGFRFSYTSEEALLSYIYGEAASSDSRQNGWTRG